MTIKTVKNAFIRHILLILLWNYRKWLWVFGDGLIEILWRIAWIVGRRERRIAIGQLSRVYPEWSQSRTLATAKACTRHLARSLIEALELWRLGDKALSNVCFEADGEARLDAAVRGGRGVVVATGHIGNWELMAAAIARRWPTQTIVRRSYDPRLNEWIEAFRHGYGIDTIARDAENLGDRLSAVFKRGEILGVLMDQDTDVPGLFAPFFGMAAYTPSGAIQLARKNEAPLFVVWIRREENGHRILVEGPLDALETNNREEALKLWCEKTNETLECAIRLAPEQWVWFHERWRRGAPGAVGDVGIQCSLPSRHSQTSQPITRP